MIWASAMEMISQGSYKQDKKKIPMIPSSSSIGADLEHLEPDRSIKSHPNDNIKRRTLVLKKSNKSWGFTIQSYGVKHKKTGEIEIMTYVDYIEITGPAYMAGMRRGDVILSVNGEMVDGKSHRELVSVIRKCGDLMRMVVMFEDCCKKVELHDRIFRLKEILAHKKHELKELELQERELIDDYCHSRGLSRFDRIRQSMISTVSTQSWDRYSLITSANILEKFPIPHVPSSVKSSIEGDDSSIIDQDEDGSNVSYADSDADSGMCVCCPNMEEQIVMKDLKNSGKCDRKMSISTQNENIPPSNSDLESDFKKRRYSIPFMSHEYVYINEQDESTTL